MQSWTSVHVTEARDILAAQVTSSDTYYAVTIPVRDDASTLLVLTGREVAVRLRDVLDEALADSSPRLTELGCRPPR